MEKEFIAMIEDEAVKKTENKSEDNTKASSNKSLSQKNAVVTAQDYLGFTAFSKSGLIEQLVYEGFSNEDATHAVNAIGL